MPPSLLMRRIHLLHIAILVSVGGFMGCRPLETGSQSSSQSDSVQRLHHEPDELSQNLPPQMLFLLKEHFPDYILPLATTLENPTPFTKPDNKVTGKPLAEAVVNGDVESVRRLLLSGYPADETHHGESLLISAARYGHADICKLLLDAGLDVHGTIGEEPSSITPLQAATQSRSVETVKLILSRGGKLKPTDLLAMRWAIESGSVETVKLLLAHGGKLTTSASDEHSAVNIAIHSGNIDMLNLLIDEGEAADKFNYLCTAIYYGPKQSSVRRKFVERLVAAGAADDVNVSTHPDLLIPVIATGDMKLLQFLESKLPVDYSESHLQAAFQSGNVDLCRYILSKGVRAQPNPEVGKELMRMALVEHRSLELVNLAIEAGEKNQYCAQSSACTSFCETRDFAHPLYHAVMKNDLSFCRYLIREYSLDTNLWGSLIFEPYEYEDGIEYFQKGNTILFAAVFDDNAEALKLLLKYTQPSGRPPLVDINAQNGVGHTVLHEAVNFGAARCVQLLLAAGADPTVARHDDGYTPLHIAMQRHLIPHHNTDKPLPAISKMFPLLAAATMSRGDKDWVNRKSANGESILHRHARAGHPWICQKLIELGANVNAVDNWGQTPLNQAMHGIGKYPTDDATKARYIATCLALLDHGTDITQVGTPGSPNYLCQAAANNCYEVYDALLNLNAQPNLKQNAGSLLCSAAKFNKPDRIQQLLDWGADINAQDEWDGYSTALHQAARFHLLEMCELLIAHGANVNARDKHGQTPLFELLGWARHAANLRNKEIQSKAFPVLTLLLKHGADPTVKTNSTTYESDSGSVLEVFKHMPQSFRDLLTQ